MATETANAKQTLIQNTFRRSSLTDHGVQKIEIGRIPTILGQMGQPFNEAKLNKSIRQLDPKNTGFLDHEGYNRLCKEFVTQPAALSLLEGDEFSFKHLIGLGDFARP